MYNFETSVPALSAFVLFIILNFSLEGLYSYAGTKVEGKVNFHLIY